MIIYLYDYILCMYIYIYNYIYIYIIIYIYTSRAGASRVTEVSREGRTYKDKGEPIGTAPDPLAGTAVDCVISWESFSLTFLALDMMSSLSLETEVVSAAFRFLLASLSLGVSFSGHLLLLTFSSLHISFSWRGFRLAPFFLFPVVSQFYFETSFC